MLRSSLACALALASFGASGAFAAETTVSYQGLVTRADGPHASAFATGDAITVQYVVDDAVADFNPDPSAGQFIGGLRELRISIPAAGVDAVTGPGTVQTFDNHAGPSDQAFFYAAATGGELAGLAITQAEVDFIETTASGDVVPAMLADDALPTTALVTDDSFALLYTSEGYTFVYFLAEPEEPALEDLVIDGHVLLDELSDDGSLRRGHASAWGGKLEEILASVNADDIEQACGALRAYGNHVAALERTHKISAETAHALRELAAAIGQAIGC